METLERVFGYKSFRHPQQEIIGGLIEGNDAFVLMPTGGGKSLCYQIPALHRRGVGIVVSPLISLMKDQVDALRANGVRAVAYNSALSQSESREVLTALTSGKLELLYVAPERLMQGGFLQKLDYVDIALFAIDEAHCISHWGHDFRPEYVTLGKLRERFPKVPLIALTATAEPRTRIDIVERLNLSEAREYISSFDRPNIRYSVIQKSNPAEQLAKYVRAGKGLAGIVYCGTRKRVEDVAGMLRQAGISAEAYHAGMPDRDRKNVQERFLREDVDVIVATVAFGMGIDKPNVRFVVHYDVPKHIEGYYQETGRAGRDGLPSDAILLFSLSDYMTAKRLIETGENRDRNAIEIKKLEAMKRFAESFSCRRKQLLAYFGEEHSGDCGNCDTCLDPRESTDATEDVKAVLMCIYESNQRYGTRLIVDILMGADTERIRSADLGSLPSYGKGGDHDSYYWDAVINQLLELGYIRKEDDKYPILKLTPLTKDVLREDKTVSLVRPAAPGSKKRRKKAVSVATPVDRALFEKLRALRKHIADEDGVPPYVVFGDATLIEMAARKPTDRSTLGAISGVGIHKLQKYGERFLAAISQE